MGHHRTGASGRRGPDEATNLKSYSAELKDSIVAKMLPPHNVGVAQLVRETGIPRDTLYGWRSRALARGAAAVAGTAGRRGAVGRVLPGQIQS
jgi:transposase-like protein